MAYRLSTADLKGKVRPDAKNVVLKTGDHRQVIPLVYQKTGYGEKRFFLCTYCSKRVQYLFLVDGKFKCRKCSGVRYGTQNCTKGGYREIEYRMQMYAGKHNIAYNLPFDYLNFACDCRVRKASFRKHLQVLQALENMRFQAIMYNTKYKSDVLRLVISGKHPLLQSCSLMDLRENFYDWYTGKRFEPMAIMEVLRERGNDEEYTEICKV